MQKVTKIVVDPKENVLDPRPIKINDNVMDMKTPTPMPRKTSNNISVISFVVAAILLGVGTGFVFAKKSTASSGNNSVGVQTSNSVQTDSEAGINDSSAFPDSATGTLVDGGVRGEGTHHLDRSASNEKEVALSSTVINLDKFVGKKVEIKGQTISSKTSGWLMDVGKIKVVQ